jgi:hypothetical protein
MQEAAPQQQLINAGACSLGLSATSQQYFSLTTNQPPPTSQQYFSLGTNQLQPSATSQTNMLAWERRRLQCWLVMLTTIVNACIIVCSPTLVPDPQAFFFFGKVRQVAAGFLNAAPPSTVRVARLHRPPV